MTYRTINIADVYACIADGDAGGDHLLADPRARLVDTPGPSSLWTWGEIDPDETYRKMLPFPALCTIALHYWHHGVRFDLIDVGANFGLTVAVAAIFHARCGRRVLCHAFEPGAVFEMLQRTVEANGLSDAVRCMRVAASDETGEATFYLSATHSAGSSLRDVPDLPNVEAVTVPTLRLDDYDQLRDVPGLIVKIDAEGADFRVLAGMPRLLAERLCTIQLEYTPAAIAEPATHLAALAEDYRLLELQPDGVHAAQLPTSAAGLAKWTAELMARGAVTDVILVPRRLPGADNLVALLTFP